MFESCSQRPFNHLCEKKVVAINDYVKTVAAIGFFDIVPWLRGPHGVLIEKGTTTSFKGLWKGRKSNFKKHEFVLRGGYKEPIKIRDFPPTDVKIDEWRKLCDHFTSEKHLKRSRSSKVNRSKQLYSSNQGTKSYAQSRYEEFNEETNEFPDLIDHFRAKHMKGGNGRTQWPKRDATRLIELREAPRRAEILPLIWPHGVLIEKGTTALFKGLWKGRKSNFKKHEFVLRGDYKEPIKIRDFPPTDVKIHKWRKLCDHFTSEKHLKRSRSSKVNMSKQLYSSNQGTKSYVQSRYEEFNEETNEFPDLIDHFGAKHMKGGKWNNTVAEERYASPILGFLSIPLVTVGGRSGSLVGQGSTYNRVCGRECSSAVPVTTLLNPTQFMDVVRDPLKYVVALEDDVAREDGVAPGDELCPNPGYLDSGKGGEKKKKKKGTGMESNTSKLASNINDESDVPIEKPIDIPNFTIEEAVVRSNVTSPHSKTTGHGRIPVTPKPTKATGLSSTSTSGTINYTTGQMCSSSLYLNGYCHNKVGDEMKKTVGTYYDCVPSIYSIKLSSTLSIMATIRKLDANVPNDADYDIWLPKDSVHENGLFATIGKIFLKESNIGERIFLFMFSSTEGIDLMLRDGSWMIIEVPIFLNKQSPSLLEEKCVLVDEDGKPLEKVDYSGDHGSEDEVDHVDNEMASFLAKTSGVALWYKSCFRSNGGKKFYGGC
ncbi:hypothetical protein Tco_0053339 [Tanacetum coccineum]